MDIKEGTIIYLEDEQYFTLPSYVTKVRLEVHGGRGGRGGDSDRGNGSPGSDGSSISCILDLSKIPTSSRTLYAVMGHNGANGGSVRASEGMAGGGGGGGGSSAILLGDILIIQAQGGRGGDGGSSIGYSRFGDGGKGGKGYINGGDGTRGSQSSGKSVGGSGGAGGGSDYIFEGLENVDVTTEYTPGLLLLEVLEIRPTLIKSNNKYYTYRNNEFIEVEPTVENFKENFVDLSQLTTPTDKVVLTMEGGEESEDGKIYRKTIDMSKYKSIEKIGVR